MDESKNSTRDILTFSLVLCLYLLASLLFTQQYFAGTIEWRQARLEKMINFEADAPFQFRVLAPLVIRLVVHTTGLDAYSTSKILTVVWTFFSLLAFRALLRIFFPLVSASLGALLLPYAMYWNYAALGIWRMPFDIPAILLFTTCLLYLLHQRWSLLYPLFVLGAMNRETILVVTVAFVFLHWKRAEFFFVLKHTGFQLALWLFMRTILAFSFRESEGGQFQNQFATNISNLLSGKITAPLLSSFGGLWLPAFLGLHVVEQQIRRLLFLTVPFVGLMIVVGNLHELRIYNELVPVICMGALASVIAFSKRMGTDRQDFSRRPTDTAEPDAP